MRRMRLAFGRWLLALASALLDTPVPPPLRYWQQVQDISPSSTSASPTQDSPSTGEGTGITSTQAKLSYTQRWFYTESIF